jgi:Homeodomain-like domain
MAARQRLRGGVPVPRKRNKPVFLTGEDRATLEDLIACGHAPARRSTHARILLKADQSEEAPGQAWPDTRIADALQISRSTVSRVRARFVEEGLQAALVHRRPKKTKPKKLDGSQEAHLIALACSQPPEGRKRWSLRLLAERFVGSECAEEPISRELVRRTLKKVP